ncbi:hypothetical protein [Desulfonema magnum]|uniref:Uncharacterized protein n=1 Tax=Desulfonema magnum TaxID=45655 RepID=A0A975GRA4_9BACT|nr:hypothetical protein [Desulfonema magnum]QTA90836.1 Uncharacterized protein dnm_068980 [Desulfonema magnum]
MKQESDDDRLPRLSESFQSSIGNPSDFDLLLFAAEDLPKEECEYFAAILTNALVS